MPRNSEGIPPAFKHRLPELDSVRGLASLTVVFLHFYNMWLPDSVSDLKPWMYILLKLLKPFYAGSESVILFFVLSGLVLSFPYLSGRPQSYPKYLVRRTLRIYGPYVIALLLAISAASIWHGHSYHGLWAEKMWANPVDPHLILHHLALVGVYNWHEYDFVIWSLIYEMRISIIFPLLFGLIARLSTVASLAAALALSGVALVFAPATADTSARYSLPLTLHYMVPFIAGIVIACKLPLIAEWWRVSSPAVRWMMAIGSALAFSYDRGIVAMLFHLLKHSYTARATAAVVVSNYLALIGSIGLITIALNAAPVRQFLNGRPAHFLGRISYSLYLVHPIVLGAVTFACGDKLSPWIQFPVYVAGALLLAWAFCAAVEEFFIRQSRKVQTQPEVKRDISGAGPLTC